MTLNQRIQAANIDCMRHPKFALLAGVIMMGKSEVTDKLPTAATNGKDKLYGAAFIEGMTRKQLRYLVLHENFHVALKHCVLYKDIKKKHARRVNKAQDYVINGLIEEMDPQLSFVERPTTVPPLVDKKYQGMSFQQVFNLLPEDPEDDDGGGGGGDSPFDEHIDADEMTHDEQQDLIKQIDDANRQGQMIANKLAGKGEGGRDIFGLAADRTTDWISALREFISSVSSGDDNSRFCPPNKRLLASGFILPSHFTETVGEIIIAADTSGSMYPYYKELFGEVAAICRQVKPATVRVLWWDTAVSADQQFAPSDYDQIAGLLKPKGGGGTTPEVVTKYIAKHKIDAKAIVWLSDGYIGCSDPVTTMPSLWGVVNNDSFVAQNGKTLHINI
jgi:predicted metal-dependent peptidase